MKPVSLAFLWLLAFLYCSAQKPQEKVVVAYVTSGSQVMPEPRYVTHVNYAFGHVNKTFDGITIEDPGRLLAITALKNKNKQLKVLLSVGGWGSGGFSEMAAHEKTRKSFADSCAIIVKQYHLDGIDIDWEYPTSKAAGITATKEDTQNYTSLMKAIRSAIGADQLLTLASVDNAGFIDFKSIAPVIDFVNIMLYETDRPPKHQASLYRSPLTSYITCAESVDAHVKAGLKPSQIVLGMPFYGMGNGVDVKETILYRDLIRLKGFTRKWDPIAKAPYLANSSGKLVCSYDDPQSIAFKCAFIRKRELRGAMYWQYAGDTDDGVLKKAVYNQLIR